MIYLYIRHTVVSYARWKEVFDNHLAARQAGGATQEVLLLRNVGTPQEIVVILGWCDLAQAQLFAQSVSWQMMLQEMGVRGVPEVGFWEKVG
ncbi:MAG: hypothetical protein H6654_16885 [Ardenticatenaceae bacterium]|nr:hypothetical protein [Anaerolineales bacterium]MCB8938449.1 hypothetical protein [Ardenticatenaceae bacterium]MCB8975238.1 hypothetical protein [Ardenticatenaceae bacterium]